MADDPLDFGPDLTDVEDRLNLIGYFLSVQDILEATEALDNEVPAAPPAAFIGLSAERADENRLIGGHRQRVHASLTVLFVESAARFDRAAKYQVEKTRKAIIRQLIGWKPRGAEAALEYDRYRIVSIGDGLVWGEVSFATSYQLSI